MKNLSAAKSRPFMAFTMIEVAICLAIIGIALVGIIGILPRGLNAQRDNRQETIVAQDANMLLEMIRNGSHGQDDLTNYVFAITNYWTTVNTAVFNSGYNGYTYSNASATVTAGSLQTPVFLTLSPLNSGSNIVSLLSTPEFTDTNGNPLASLIEGGISNHVVAYVRSISGLAAEKPPQDNSIMQGDAFSYRILCVNSPISLNLPFGWSQFTNYFNGDTAYYHQKQWVWQGTFNAAGIAPDVTTGPGTNWVRNSVFADQLSVGQREIRLKFLWPLLPNMNVGNNFMNVRSIVGGQLMITNNTFGLVQYYYQPQSFVRLP